MTDPKSNSAAPPRSSRPAGRRARRSPSSRRLWGAVLLAALLLLLVTLWLLRTRVPTEFVAAPAEQLAGGIGPLGAYDLYFGTPDAAGLQRETRYLMRSGEPEEDAGTIIRALVDGPLRAGLSPWPAATVVRQIFLADDGTLYVNFGSALRWQCPRGDFMEWLLAGSLTRSLCANIPEVAGVRVMIDGESSGALIETVPLEWTLRPGMFAEVE